jgi:hypothetical protein
MKDNWYVIHDMDAFTNHARVLVYNAFGSGLSEDKDDPEIDDLISVKPEDKDELDKILSFEESLNITTQIVKKQKNKKTNSIRYVVNDIIFSEVLDSLNDRMVSNLLNNLVNKGVLETGFDNETNDFLFWIKENDKNKSEKPETD